ncbi:MAG: hypothetical protein SGILL_001213 [Bacillariaceae sp.]
MSASASLPPSSNEDQTDNAIGKSNNAQVMEALNNLINHVKSDPKCSTNPPTLSHYKTLPDDVKKAYTLIDNGALMIHSTSTKYTLVGKINLKDQVKLGTDLLRGCELIGAALHVLVQDNSGCSRAVRRLTQRAALAIFINVLHLVESFEDGTALDGNMGAQKTGAVWEACDQVLKKLLPKGNRNAIRREIFTWTRETQDTMEEFQEMIDMGPGEASLVNDTAVEEEDEEYDDFFGMGGEEHYSDDDFHIAKACLGLLKNSRGNMKIALETCEALGGKAQETQEDRYFEALLNIHEYARNVGEGVTDLGSLLYPPLSDLEELQSQVGKQAKFIKTLQDYILGLEGLPSNVLEMANILTNAADTRCDEFNSAISAAQGKR